MRIVRYHDVDENTPTFPDLQESGVVLRMDGTVDIYGWVGLLDEEDDS